MAGPDLTTTTRLLSSVVASVSPDATVPAMRSNTNAGWSSPDSILTKLFSGDPSTIAVAFLVTISFPVLLHLYFYAHATKSGVRAGGADGVPTFLVAGSVGSGKTSLITLLQKRMVAAVKDSESADQQSKTESSEHGTVTASLTQNSQSAATIGMHLPAGVPLGSNKYRSENDYEVTNSQKNATPYRIIDTPGHGKLRLEQSLSQIVSKNVSLRGVIFVVDSAAIDVSSSADQGETAKDTVQYLHDVLLNLQRRPKRVKKAKPEDVRVLLACNKQDLFTSLPPAAIKDKLQSALEEVRTSRRKGITAVDAQQDVDEDEDQTILGGGGEEKFSFKLLEEEFGVAVEVIGGAVKGDEDGRAASKWEAWIGSCL